MHFIIESLVTEVYSSKFPTTGYDPGPATCKFLPNILMLITKNFSCITLKVEHNYISSSSTVGIQLHVSALYVGHLQVVI